MYIVHNKTGRWELGISNTFSVIRVEDFFTLKDATKEEMDEAKLAFEQFEKELYHKLLAKRKK